LLARAFSPLFANDADVCIFAAGVSNSSCTDKQEFAREQQRLTEAITKAKHIGVFVYFGTCSVADPEALNTHYVQHKLAMEQLVSLYPRHLIIRLPQLAGRTPNPHTLLNYLYARISRSEAFSLWNNAKRNVIDVDDAVSIAYELVTDDTVRNTTMNIANPANYSMNNIVNAMERAVGKHAIYRLVERGSEYFIDTSATYLAKEKAGVKFGESYLQQVVGKYYEKVG
jgi:nucleoside-diphosphate-sugar epimerase